MLSGLSDLVEEREARVKEALTRFHSETSENVRIAIIKKAIDEVRDGLSRVTVAKLQDKITVDNLDEVKLHLRKELGIATKKLVEAVEKLGVSQAHLEDIRKKAASESFGVLDKFARLLDDDFDTLLIRRPSNRVQVENFSELVLPDTVSVRNLAELQSYFEDLASVIKNTFNIQIPAPQVSVEAPIVNVPQASVNVAPPDLSALLDALDPLKYLSDRPNKPLSVRLSDGQAFIKALKTLVENQEKQVAAFSQGLNVNDLRGVMRASNTGTIGTFTKTVTTAGTRVQITSADTPCFKVQVCADLGNTNPVVVGDASVVAASGSMRGTVLVPGNDPVFIPVNNLNKLWVDSQTSGDKICGSYFSY